MATKHDLLIGTRNSKLALVQAERVSNALTGANPGTKFPWRTVSVSGDVDKTSPFLKFAGPSDTAKNIWTEEMEAKLVSGELDLLVHCLKDMPTCLPGGYVLGAIVHREDPTDAFVVKEALRGEYSYSDLAQLPPGSVVGTSSTRRKALLALKYPQLVVEECRGNLDTRLRKLDDPNSPYAAIIVATAGLLRINMAHRITKRLPASEFPYAVGQGALGIEVREHDSLTQGMIQRIEDPLVRKMCLAERSLLRTLQGGCSSPVAVNCTAETPGLSMPRLRLEGTIIHPRGSGQVSAWAAADVDDDNAAEVLGAEVARRLLEDGGRELLDEISRFYKSQAG
ncbi:hypothetical protein CFD26_108855 [Aspergillus turcosus]|uniref:hydroxymethylbilane synthase n=1 Tax=Aspergillus turcosus TaxID=1245748 RepID=A0A421DHI8_9EURO|nr:hypothetical protein CFD26_108855 [Aspergillus turcosus]